MRCGDDCPLVPGIERDDWPLEDPQGKSMESVRKIRDQIASTCNNGSIEKGGYELRPESSANC